MKQQSAVVVSNLCFNFGTRVALSDLNFVVSQSEMFGIVGPNGGGKSTTFKILSTLLKPLSGSVKIFGKDLILHPKAVRSQIGVVFQFPALDKMLSVFENLLIQGHMYGMHGKDLKDKIGELLSLMNLSDRKNDRVDTLSGGLMRRLEIAKALLHKPGLLILDEPTTGLDPLARRDVWNYLRQLKEKDGLTILVTTHLLEEADLCDKVAFLNNGKIVASGTPSELKATIDGEVITLKTGNPVKLRGEIEEKFGTRVSIIGNDLRIQKSAAHEFIPALVSAFSEEIQSITLGKPTLEDIFIEKTGHHFQKTSEKR